MVTKIFAALAVALCSVSIAAADPWKDESGHGKQKHHKHKHKHDRQWPGDETPWWERGKGYWDGHFKHDHGDAPPWSDRWDRFDDDYDRPRVRVRVYEYEYPEPRYYYNEPRSYRGWREF